MKKKRKNDVPPAETLSDEEYRLIKQSVQSEKVDRSKLPHYDNSDRARLFRYIKKNKIFTVVCVVLAVCIVALLSLCIALAVKKSNENRVNTDDYTFIIGDETYTVDYKTAVRDGVLYVDMYKIAEYTGMTRSGSTSAVKFTAHENNYLRFENGSDTAVINGSMVELGGTAVVNADVCEIPYDFLNKALGTGNGLKLSLDRETNTLKVTRRMYKTDDKDAVLPVEILFYSDSFEIIMSIQRTETEEENYEYPIDISGFLASIDPENAEDYLVLANKTNPLGSDYKPSDLTLLECRTASNRQLYLCEDAANAVEAMMLAMSTDGITDVSVTSAFRAYSRQKELFEGYVAKHVAEGMSEEEAIEAALEYSAKPGTSEHQTGLCLDFITDDMTDLDESFENTAAFRWLSENAHKYGFILRYPADKVDLTGYKYEPWHYRFVGRTTAAEIHASGLCLEQYLELC